MFPSSGPSIKMAPKLLSFAMLLACVLGAGFVEATTSDSSGSSSSVDVNSIIGWDDGAQIPVRQVLRTAGIPVPSSDGGTGSTDSNWDDRSEGGDSIWDNIAGGIVSGSDGTGSTVGSSDEGTGSTVSSSEDGTMLRAGFVDIATSNESKLQRMLFDRRDSSFLEATLLECQRENKAHGDTSGCRFAEAFHSQPGNDVMGSLERIAERLQITQNDVTGNHEVLPKLLTISPNGIAVFFTLNIALAWMKKESFFGGGSPDPYYDMYDLLTVPEEQGVRMLMRMCGMVNAPISRRLLTRLWRSLPFTKSSAWDSKGRLNPVHKEAHPDSMLASVCDFSLALLVSIQTDIELYRKELNRHRIGVEANVDGATNALRLLSKTCNQKIPVCNYQHSALSKTGKSGSGESIAVLEDAFVLVTGLGLKLESDSSVSAQINDEALSVPLLANPKRYTQVYTRIFWYEPRYIFRSSGKTQVVKALLGEKKRLSNLTGTSSKQTGKTSYHLKGPGQTQKNGLIKAFETARIKTNVSPFGALNQFGRRKKKKRARRARMTMYALRTGASSDFALENDFSIYWDSYLFQMLLVSRGRNPMAAILRNRRIFQRAPTSIKLIQSQWIPTIVKGFLSLGASTNTAKVVLDDMLTASVRDDITKAFTWVAHTGAMADINTHHKFFQDVRNRPVGQDAFQLELHQMPNLGILDSTVKRWSEWGYTDAQFKQMAKGEVPVDKTETVPAPDTTRWDIRLNQRIAWGLDTAIRHPYARSALRAGDDRATVLELSRKNVRGSLEQALFLGRIAPPMRKKNIFRRAFNALYSLLAAGKKDFGAWFGVVIDMKRVMNVVQAVKKASESFQFSRFSRFSISARSAQKVPDAFIKIVEEEVLMKTAIERREPAFSYDYPKPKFSKRLRGNKGFLHIRSGFAHLGLEDKEREFQMSVCSSHCTSIWKFIMTFIYSIAQNPGKMDGYEEKYVSVNEVERLTDKDAVNEFRAKLNIQNDYLDNIMDKETKKEMAKMKHGAGTHATFAFKLASMGLFELSFPSTGTVLAFQAPYMGNYINKMLKKKKAARRGAILAVLTLGFFTVYTVLSSMSAVRHLKNAGIGPPVRCFTSSWNNATDCIPQIAENITSTTATVARDVFTIGLFAGIAPYFIFPMMAVAVWQILKAKFTVLLQFELSVQHMFKRIWRFAKNKLYFMGKLKRKFMMKKIEDKAKQKIEDTKQSNGVKTPSSSRFNDSVRTADQDFASLRLEDEDTDNFDSDVAWKDFLRSRMGLLEDDGYSGIGLPPTFFSSIQTLVAG